MKIPKSKCAGKSRIAKTGGGTCSKDLLEFTQFKLVSLNFENWIGNKNNNFTSTDKYLVKLAPRIIN